MRVCVVPSDKGGCGCYRMYWPAKALIEQGFDITVLEPDDAGEEVASEYDVIVIQRPLRYLMHEHVKRMQANGIAVVVDIDDDFSCIHPRNVNYTAFHPAYNKASNWNHLAATMRIADMVTVTTPALAKRYGGHGRVSILPNYVPNWYLGIAVSPNEQTTIGWSGSTETHPDDLEVTRDAVQQVINNTGAKFRAVGTGRGVAKALRLREEPEATGWREIDGDYQRAVASLDVGMVPLDKSAFNEGKSWLKGLEFASLGVPFVASSTYPYRSLNALGAGQIAVNHREWRNKLQNLVEDESARKELAEQGRKVAAELTYENKAWRWAETWEQAIANRRAKVAA